MEKAPAAMANLRNNLFQWFEDEAKTREQAAAADAEAKATAEAAARQKKAVEDMNRPHPLGPPPVKSTTVMGMPIDEYYANKNNLDRAQQDLLDDPYYGAGRPVTVQGRNHGYVSTSGPIYQRSNEALLHENARHSGWRKR